MKYRKGVFIVTYIKTNQGLKYLLLKRKLHWRGWEFPKGGKNSAESDKKAVLRELKEETSQIPLSLKKYLFSGKYKYPKNLPDRENLIGQTFNLYSAELKNRKIKFDKAEHSKYLWLGFEKAMKKLTWPNQKKCLKIVNKEMEK